MNSNLTTQKHVSGDTGSSDNIALLGSPKKGEGNFSGRGNNREVSTVINKSTNKLVFYLICMLYLCNFIMSYLF